MEPETPRNIKRQIAIKVRVKDLINGRYVREEGWAPNYIITNDGRRISRINVIGTVVAKPIEEGVNYQNAILDDGSAKIAIRDFNENSILNSIVVGDVVMLIGKPREYGNEKYTIPEILKKIDDKRWIEVRRLELEKEKKTDVKEKVEEGVELEKIEEDVVEEEVEEIPLPQKVYNLIKERDRGDGVDVEELVNIYGEGTEKIINNLLKEGELFEIKPGKLKVLE